MTVGGAGANCMRASAPPIKRDEFVVNDLDDRLRRRQRRQHVGADGLFLDGVDEFFGDRKVDVGFEQRDAHFARDLVDVRFRQPAAVAKALEDRAEAFA